MSKIYFLRGLPASGKSTWALEKIKNGQGKVKRVNKDLLREMLDGGKWSKGNEKFVKHIRDIIIEYTLLDGLDIIVDDTNLSDNHLNRIKEFVSRYNAELEIVDFTDVPPSECIKRDQKRQNYVGEKVIRKMYSQFLSTPITRIDPDSILPNAIICDIDGTLALHNDRSPYDGELCETDSLNRNLYGIIELFRAHNIKTILLSGRPDKFKEHTERWLKANNVNYDALFMRKGDDMRGDDIVKRELYLNNVHGQYHIRAVFDDRPRVCLVWHQLGLPLFKVGDPYDDF